MIIGLTGRIASGKNIVAGILEEKGYEVIDVDIVGHEVLKKPSVKDKIIHIFGNSVVDTNEISRKKLGRIVFSDRGKLSTLESIMHPAMVENIINILRQKSPADNVVINAAVLFEMGLNKLTDEIWVVDSYDNDILDRLLKKGFSLEQASERLSVQMSRETYISMADVVIENNDTFQNLRLKVEKALSNH